MKNLFILSKHTFVAGLIILSLASCKNEIEPKDTEKAAKEKNEAQFKIKASEKEEAAFFVDMTEIDLTTIEIAQLAEMKTTNPDVKDFSTMLIETHKKTLAKLKELADSRQLSVPVSITDDGKDIYNSLDEKTGKNFNTKFMDLVIDNHEKAIKEMEKASQDTDKDQNARTWARDQIENLTKHLKKAKTLREKLEKE